MAKVTGIGGVFFKARDPNSLRHWYRTHLGFDVQDGGGAQLSRVESSTVKNLTGLDSTPAPWCIKTNERR